MTSIASVSFSRLCNLLTLWVASSVAYSPSSQAAQWQLGSGVTTELSHTRTVDKAADEKTNSDVVWGMSPYMSLSGRGKSLDVDARLGIDHTSNIGTGHTATRPAALINGEFTVIDRRAWISLDANVSQKRESSNGSAEDFLVDLESEGTQLDFSFSERAFLPLGTTSQVNGTHRFSISYVSGDGAQPSQTHLLGIDTISYLQSARSFVITELNYQHTDIGDTGTFESGEAAVGIGIPVSEISSEVILSIGREWYDLMLVDQNLDGFFWATDFRWRPIKSFQFNAGYSERSYGRTPLARASLVGRRNTLSIKWSRQSAFQRNFQPGVEFQYLTLPSDSAEVGTIDVEGVSEPDTLSELSSWSPFIDDIQSVNEEISLDHEYRGRLSTLKTGIGVTKRSSINNLDSSESTLIFATLGLTRAIGQSISATARVRVAESKDEEVGDQQRISRISLAFTWRL